MKKNIPVASPDIGSQEAIKVFKTVKSGWISMGSIVKQFEKNICKYTGAKYAVAMNNGTSTLDALLTIFNIKNNDEVIVPSMNYISSANVVMYKKAKLKLCDVNYKTLNVDFNELVKKISKKTKLIIVTDLKGLPVDYDKISKLCKSKRIPIISDSAESFGGEYKKKKIGTQLLAHSFSLFANKNITTGEGGLITTNNNKIYKKLLIIRNQGQTKRYNHVMLGNNYRMTDVQAVIGIEQLKKINLILKNKNRIASYYSSKLINIKGLKIPEIPKYVTQHGWYNYTIRVDPKIRDKLVKYLSEKGIETRVSFPPVHIQPYYKKKFKFKKSQFPKSFKSYHEIIDLPIWSNLKREDLDYIISKIKFFFK